MKDNNVTTSRNAAAMQNITLQEINDEHAYRMYPVIGFLFVAMTVGMFGNLLVFCVYYTRFKRTPTNLLVLVLSAFDTLIGATQIPFEIVDLLYPYMYGDVMFIPCKIFRFTGSTLICGSVLFICAIAFERFKKISQPLNPLGMRKTRYLVAGCITYVTILCLPMTYMYGYHTEDLSSYGVVFNGSDCAVDDKVANTFFTRIYGAFILLNFSVYLTFCVYCYIRIAIIVRQRKKKMTVKFWHCNKSFAKNGETESRELSGLSAFQIDSHRTDSRRTSQELTVVSGGEIRTVKMTLIFLVITTVCVISFLPVLTFDVVNSLIDIDGYRKQNATMDVFLEFCQKTFCINTCSNPIIYSIMNPRFRKACADFFKYRCNKKRAYR